ncbi:MAG TPA: PAS sensor protein, partial [Methylococcaceae bacterium]|nr:PAS sensor protein [Methylococcaceae bacterium]
GKLIYFLGVQYDITRQIVDEETINKLNKELESL